MAEEPDRLRRDIEGTRASLTRDVDVLADKTSPRQAARRRWTAVREKVMGSTDHARHATDDAVDTVKDKTSQLGDVASDKAQDAAGVVRSAPQAVARQTQGNPIAAGVIAFGVGMLAATLIPVTDAEQRAGRQIRENSGELTDRIKDVAGDVRPDLKSDVQEAATQLSQTAQDAAMTTKDQAQSSAQDAAQQTKHAAQQR
jgi:gas vesicle protein